MPPLILTSRTPWRRRPSGLLELDRSSPQANGLVSVFGSDVVATDETKWTQPNTLLHEATAQGKAIRLTTGSMAPTLSAVLSSGQLSFSIWAVSPSTMSGTQTIAAWQSVSDANDGVRLYTNGANIGMVHGGVADYASTVPVSAGAFIHLFGSTVASGTYAYGINGVLAQSGAAGTISGTPGLIKVGSGGQLAWNEYWAGHILECRIYARALSLNEFWTHYDPSTRWNLYAPVVRRTYIVLAGSGNTSAPGKGTATLTGYAPTVALNHAITPGKGTLAATGYAPAVSVTSGLTSLPGKGTVTITGYAPTVTQNLAVTPGKGTLTATGYAPSVTVSAAGAITPWTGALVATGYAPTVTVQQRITLGVGVVTATGYAPTVVVALPLTYNVLKASFTVTTPAVDFTLTTPSVTFTAEGA